MSKSEYARKLKAYHDDLRRRYPNWTEEMIGDCCVLPEALDAVLRRYIDFPEMSNPTT